MPTYESGDFDPPAPIIRARVGGPEGIIEANVPFLLDSGADVSVVPLSVARAVGATIETTDVLVRYCAGEVARYDRATLSVQVGKFRFHGPFLAADVEYGEVGRNILNFLVVTLDGPALTWSA